MNKKISLILLPLLTLLSCQKKANHYSEANLNGFLEIVESLENKNYTIDLAGDIYEYLGEDIINTKFKGVPYQGGYIRKDNVGIFDYVFVNNNVEIQGMISLNTEISPLDLLANPEYLFRVSKNKWQGINNKKNSVELNISSLGTQEKNFVAWSFGIDANISNLQSINSVTAKYNNKCTFTVEYKDKIDGKNKTKSFEVDKINQTENAPITNYLNSGEFTKKTD